MEIETLKSGIQMVQAGIGKLNMGGLDYTLDVLVKAHELLLTRFAPYLAGSRVRLTKTPVINKDISWGWMGAKHFLVKGAMGIVREVECSSDGELKFMVEFDDETYMDNGVEELPSKKHTFCFGEDYLEKAGNDAQKTEGKEMTEFVVEVGTVDRESFASDGMQDDQVVDIGDLCTRIGPPGQLAAFIQQNNLSPGDKVRITLEKVGG